MGYSREILVTGATGFIGHHVAKRLIERGCKIKALARPNSRRDNLKALATGSYEVVEGDLTDADSLKSAMRGVRTLYHVAADYRLWSRDPQELYRANVDGTRTLLQIASDCGVERVVYTSTVGALGIPKGGSSGTETTPVSEANMIGHYKRSKFLGEEVAREFAGKGLSLVIVNPSAPVGENDIKPTPTGQIIVDFMKRKLPAYVDTGLNLIDVRDCAEGIILAGERGRSGERYILGNKNMTLSEVFEALSEITGLPAPRIRLPYGVAWLAVGIENIVADRILHKEPEHPFEGVKMAKYKMFFDAGKAVAELGLPQSDPRKALERAVRWFQDNGYVK